MTLQDRIKRVKEALAEIDGAREHWIAGDATPTIGTEERSHRKYYMLAHRAEFGRQTDNVRNILAAHEAIRLKVQEAYDKVESIRPQLSVILGDDPYIMRTVIDVCWLLKAALEREQT